MKPINKGQIVHAVPPKGKRGYLLAHRKAVVTKGARKPNSLCVIRIEENSLYNGVLVTVEAKLLRDGEP